MMMKCPIEECGGLAEGEEYCPKCGQTLVPVAPPSAPPPRLFPEAEVAALRAEILKANRRIAQLESRETGWLAEISRGRECARSLTATQERLSESRERIAELESENASLKKEHRVCQICHSREVGSLGHVPLYPDPGYSRER